MRFTIVHSVIAGGLVAACAQMSQRGREPPVPSAPAAAVPSRLVQMDYGRDAKFVLCAGTDCPTVTPKTTSSTPEVRPAAMEVAPPAPPPPAKPAPAKPMAHSLTVEFPFGGSALSAREQAALVAALPVAKRAERIVIKGRTDNVGPEGANNQLALQRAVAVRNFLRQRLQATDNVIVIDAKGSCCYVANNDSAEGRARNRRVEVEFSLEG